MNKFKKVAVTVKNHVARHKFGYTVGGVAITAVALLKMDQKAFAAFLETKGIDPNEFFNPELITITV